MKKSDQVWVKMKFSLLKKQFCKENLPLLFVCLLIRAVEKCGVLKICYANIFYASTLQLK